MSDSTSPGLSSDHPDFLTHLSSSSLASTSTSATSLSSQPTTPLSSSPSNPLTPTLPEPATPPLISTTPQSSLPTFLLDLLTAVERDPAAAAANLSNLAATHAATPSFLPSSSPSQPPETGAILASLARIAAKLQRTGSEHGSTEDVVEGTTVEGVRRAYGKKVRALKVLHEEELRRSQISHDEEVRYAFLSLRRVGRRSSRAGSTAGLSLSSPLPSQGESTLAFPLLPRRELTWAFLAAVCPRRLMQRSRALCSSSNLP